MTKAAITEVTHVPLEGEELAPPSSAFAGLSTAALPDAPPPSPGPAGTAAADPAPAAGVAAGAIGPAEAGFVRKVPPTKVLPSTNVEFDGGLVGGVEGERDGAFVAGRKRSSSMYNSSGISKGANVGGFCMFTGHDIDLASWKSPVP
jgi:hypothetical protein